MASFAAINVIARCDVRVPLARRQEEKRKYKRKINESTHKPLPSKQQHRSQYKKRELERTLNPMKQWALNTAGHPIQVFISTRVNRNYSLRSNQQLNEKIPGSGTKRLYELI